MKRLFIISLLLFTLTGCSKQKVNYPYEILSSNKILTYYDEKEKFSNNFSVLNIGNNFLDSWQKSFHDKKNNIVINSNGELRCISIENKSTKTYKNISVGDSISKIEESFLYENTIGDFYCVLFDENSEEQNQLSDQNIKDNWIWINYLTENSKITNIVIYDVKFGRTSL